MEHFDNIYKKGSSPWGDEVNNVVKSNIELIPKNTKVIDLGTGMGRDILAIAKLRKDLKCIAVDSSSVGINQVLQKAEQLKVAIKTIVANLKGFKLDSFYGAILIMGVLDFFKKAEREKIIQDIKNSLMPGGLVFLGVCTTLHPAYKKWKEKTNEVEKNFFVKKDGFFFYFYEPKELLEQFADYEVLYYEDDKETVICLRKPL